MNEQKEIVRYSVSGEQPDTVTVSVSDLERESAIRGRIDAITQLPVKHGGQHSVDLSIAIVRLEMLRVDDDQFGPLVNDAQMAVDTTLDALRELRDGARRRESEEAERDVQARARSLVEYHNREQATKQREAMHAIQSLQSLSAMDGPSDFLCSLIADVESVSVTEEQFGMASSTVAMARTLALDALRLRYEQSLIKEGAAAMQQAVIEEYQVAEPTARELAIANAMMDAVINAFARVSLHGETLVMPDPKEVIAGVKVAA